MLIWFPERKTHSAAVPPEPPHGLIWIQTFTGRQFCIDVPRVEDVAIEDIAHSLSLQCRFGGHTCTHYSVAQHCVLTSLIVDSPFALDALLHDAAEAYVNDLMAPVKELLGERWDRHEQRIGRCVAFAFGVRWPIPDEVRRADLMLLRAEVRDLLPGGPVANWTDRLPEGFDDPIVPWSADLAEHRFLERFHQLAGSRRTPMRGLAGAAAELSERGRR